ncbi:hypothetical protein AB0D08_34720 [Kitasatospora sp. NPDC048540]|uniref:LppU/SCO3897 family protein n=1 Tax=Kitasatospora sp. NPDC048540 TaxID=3155634 RepID=UPI0033C4EE86
MSAPPPPQLPYGSPAAAPPAPPLAQPPAQPWAPPQGQIPGQFPGQVPGQVPGQQPWGQQPWAQPAAPAGYGPYCRFCGSMPATEATIRGHQGLIVIMKFLKLQGPFCRTCGIAAHRDMTAKSLWQGWWGFGSMLINPITMLINLPQRAKINKLAPPVPGAPGTPMNPGKPLYRRVAVLGLLVPALIVAAIVFAAQRDADYASAGDCLQRTGTASNPDVAVVSCSGSDAEFKVLGRFDHTGDGSKCEAYPETTTTFVRTVDYSPSYLLCLRRISR